MIPKYGLDRDPCLSSSEVVCSLVLIISKGKVMELMAAIENKERNSFVSSTGKLCFIFFSIAIYY